MNNLERYQAYADAFEETYVDNNWHRLEQYFAEDASYDPGDGTKAEGRAAVLAQLQGGVNGLDRQFDTRTLTSSPPSADGDTVSIAWQLTLSKQGVPDLSASGVEHATYVDGAIHHLQDVFDDGVAEALGQWMAAHGDSLHG